MKSRINYLNQNPAESASLFDARYRRVIRVEPYEKFAPRGELALGGTFPASSSKNEEQETFRETRQETCKNINKGAVTAAMDIDSADKTRGVPPKRASGPALPPALLPPPPPSPIPSPPPRPPATPRRCRRQAHPLQARARDYFCLVCRPFASLCVLSKLPSPVIAACAADARRYSDTWHREFRSRRGIPRAQEFPPSSRGISSGGIDALT
jgi:hypothetical protein